MKEHGPEASWTLLSRFRIDELPRCKYWVDLVYVTEKGNVLMEGTESFITQEKIHNSTFYLHRKSCFSSCLMMGAAEETMK